MEMRALTAKDIAPVCKILSKIGITEILTNLQSLKEQDGLEAMAKIIDSILYNLDKVQDELFSFVSSVVGQDVSKLGMAEFTEILAEVIKKEEFRDFFTAAFKLLGRK